MTAFASDTFNRADGAIGSTDGAGLFDPAAWVVNRGTLVVSGNRAAATAYVAGPSTTGWANATIDLGQADLDDLSFTVVNHANTYDFGCVFRYVDDDNTLFLTSSNGQASLWKSVAGVSTQLVGNYAVTDGQTVAAVVAGSTLKLYVNGSLKQTVDESFNQCATKHGIYLEGNHGVFTGRLDNFSASGTIVSTDIDEVDDLGFDCGVKINGLVRASVGTIVGLT